MATVAEPELAGIGSPIPGDNPAGVDLREDEGRGGDFRLVRDARNDARRFERQVDEGGGDTSEATTKSFASWNTVVDLGQQLLAESSKDLEIVAYMTEAWARLDGFAGVARGFRIARELAANFWDNLYPLPDEDGVATRVLPLTWLNGLDGEGSLIGPLTRIPLTEGSSAGPFALWQYRQAVELAGTTDAAGREDRIRQGAATREQIDRACQETNKQFFPKLRDSIVECQREFVALEKLLNEKCGIQDAPPTSQITTTLESCLAAVMDIGKRWIDQPGAEGSTNGEGSYTVGTGNRAGGAFGLSTRDDAFRILLNVADFFERTEPQSLIPAQLRRVVEWGQLSPQELFARVIEDAGALEQMYKLVGIPRPQSSE